MHETETQSADDDEPHPQGLGGEAAARRRRPPGGRPAGESRGRSRPDRGGLRAATRSQPATAAQATTCAAAPPVRREAKASATTVMPMTRIAAFGTAKRRPRQHQRSKKNRERAPCNGARWCGNPVVRRGEIDFRAPVAEETPSEPPNVLVLPPSGERARPSSRKTSEEPPSESEGVAARAPPRWPGTRGPARAGSLSGPPDPIGARGEATLPEVSPPPPEAEGRPGSNLGSRPGARSRAPGGVRKEPSARTRIRTRAGKEAIENEIGQVKGGGADGVVAPDAKIQVEDDDPEAVGAPAAPSVNRGEAEAERRLRGPRARPSLRR